MEEHIRDRDCGRRDGKAETGTQTGRLENA